MLASSRATLRRPEQTLPKVERTMMRTRPPIASSLATSSRRARCPHSRRGKVSGMAPSKSRAALYRWGMRGSPPRIHVELSPTATWRAVLMAVRLRLLRPEQGLEHDSCRRWPRRRKRLHTADEPVRNGRGLSGGQPYMRRPRSDRLSTVRRTERAGDRAIARIRDRPMRWYSALLGGNLLRRAWISRRALRSRRREQLQCLSRRRMRGRQRLRQRDLWTTGAEL